MLERASLPKGKLAPPVPPAVWLPRGLAGDVGASTALLVAGPGYGKSLALHELVGDALAAGEPVAWVTLEPEDRDPSSMFGVLAAAIRPWLPPLADELDAFSRAEGTAPARVWEAFFRAFERYDPPTFRLVLDDFHHSLDEGAGPGDALFDKLTEKPPGLHLHLGSRRRPYRPLARHEATGALVVIGGERLRFSSEEARAFLAARGADVDAWVGELEGWPLGLALAAASASRTRPVGADEGRARAAAYVEEEVLATMPPARRTFLLQAALLEALEPALCEATFGVPDTVDQLEALAADQLVHRLAAGAGYRLPAYLREILRDEAERHFPAATLQAWHGRAAEHLVAEGRHELALAHALAARDWPVAIAIGARCFPAMRYDGRHAAIAARLAGFPAEIAEREPTLVLWRGHSRARAGDLVEAEAAYARAQALFAARGDAAGAFKALVRRATTIVFQRDLERAGPLLLEAYAQRAVGLDEDVADLFLAQALAADARGDLDLVREHNEAALAVPSGTNPELATTHALAALNLATHALHRGDLRRARRYAARVAAQGETWRLPAHVLTGGFVAAHIDLLEGDVAAASSFVATLPASWPEQLEWHLRGIAFAVLGHFHTVRGDWTAAEAALRRSLAIFEDADYALGARVPLEGLMTLAIAREQYARALTWFADAGAPRGDHIYDLALALPLARALQLAGRPADALAELARVQPRLEALGAELLLTRSKLYEATAHLALGDRVGATAALADARARASARGYDFLLQRDQRLWAELAALERPLPGAPADKLSLGLLGVVDVRVGEMRIDHWPRRKALLLLAALALHPRGLGLPELSELLAAGDLAPTTWHVAISSLRKILEPASAKNAPSRFVLLEDERYLLAWDQIGSFDLREFEAAVTQGDRLRARDPDAAASAYERAVALYRGELLAEPVFQGRFEADREACRVKACGASTWLARYRADRGDASGAEAFWRRAIEVSPCDEELYLALIRHHTASGAEALAHHVYWDCRKALHLHLGVPPADEFERAARQLIGGRVVARGA